MVAPRQLLSKACDMVAAFEPLHAMVPGVLLHNGGLARCGVFLRYLIPGCGKLLPSTRQ